ncbi:unnamed protein product, partial [Closterium sp. NIES-54]
MSPARLFVSPSLTCSTLHSLRCRLPTRHSALLLPSSGHCSLPDSPRLGPCPYAWTCKERYFLVVVDDYSMYTTVFPFAKKSEVNSTLIRWFLATEGTHGSRVRCLHSDRGGEFCSGVLAGFCNEQGIRQSWTLVESPQHNGVAERRIGLVMDIARASMIYACAPHFLWPYALRYTAHQLNLHPRVSRPEVSPTSLWTGSLGVGSAFHVWSCLALVRDTSADKLSARAIPCVFLGFPVGSPEYSFYHPPLHQFLDSRDVRFDESVSWYTRYPCRGLPVPPPPLILTPSSPPAPASPVTPPPLVLPRQSPQQPLTLPRHATVDSVGFGAGGAATGGTQSGGARSRGAGVGGAGAGGASSGAGGADTGGASSGGAGARGTGTGGASSRGVGAGGAGTGGASSGGAGAGGAGAVGAGTKETRVGGSPTASPTAPPHRHDTRFQALHKLEREEQEQLAQERLGLQRLDQQQQQPSLLQQLFPPVSGLRALGLPSSPPVHSYTTGTSRCPPRARPSSPLADLRTVLFRSPPCRSPPVSILPSPHALSLTVSSHPVTDYYRTSRPVVSRILASLVTDPRASPSSVSALTAAVADFASTRRLDYATRVVAAPPPRPLSDGGESALGCDVLEDRQFELDFLVAASPSLCAKLLSLEGDPDALDIPTPC